MTAQAEGETAVTKDDIIKAVLALPEADRLAFRDKLEEAVPWLGPIDDDDDDEFADEPADDEPAKEGTP